MTATQRIARLAAAGAVALLLAMPVGPAVAHGPDPALGGGTFGDNQRLEFRWRAGSVPPTRMQSAIKAAAEDATESRASKAPVYAYASDGANWVMYGGDVGCGVNGLACFTRSVPNSFTVAFREQGHRFDWGTMRWCQMYDTWPDGCYDAENIALDEFGHVFGLGHHQNFGDDSDYRDAVVQTYSRTKPRSGYNAHALGVCDVATLQLLYDLASSYGRVSTCLDVDTAMSFSAPATAVIGTAVSFTATLRVSDIASYGDLRGDALSGRSVVLQRRSPGTTAWSEYATMTPGATGTYTASVTIRSTAEWRAYFRTTSAEGARGAASGARTVTAVSPCTGSPCPLGTTR